ncbi:hypothetical protein Lgra_1090 [Legionella gratiana]|uniref:Autotransporter domain-containing protein n=1 Tax=Legionella gratiana TaxID=45066 RepID=A0A378J186_9GAMM|nr:autotransporter outer membrane beta-barrel domain-containing protein [Legionella gratiana]KTD11632.1 hypothetical protein Lgra_1090 [Legionella gratiana]STX41038.1 Uncharacterised protein [Legionella gratiana]
MKKQRIVLSLFCSFYLILSFADPSLNKEKKTTGINRTILFNLQGIYSYRDFTFKSVKFANYNSFQGHSNLYVLGANNLQIMKGLTGGLFIYRADMSLGSSVLIAPTPLIQTSQSIHNNSLFGHITKSIKRHLFVDFYGGYGQNKLNYLTLMAPHTPNQQVASANNHSNNWFVSLSALYSTIFRNFLFTGAFSVLHNEIKQNGFTYFFRPNLVSNTIAPLTNKSSYLFENAEIGYKLNRTLQPFINGGLIQVVQFSNSRPLITGTLVSTSPEFNLNQNGFQVGAGINFALKKVTLRLEQQYVQRANVYHSNLSIVSLKIAMD